MSIDLVPMLGLTIERIAGRDVPITRMVNMPIGTDSVPLGPILMRIRTRFVRIGKILERFSTDKAHIKILIVQLGTVTVPISTAFVPIRMVFVPIDMRGMTFGMTSVHIGTAFQ